MRKILNILLYPIRKQPYLYVLITSLHMLIMVLCSTHNLDVHPLCAYGFPFIDAYLICLLAAGAQRIRLDWLIGLLYCILALTDIVCVLVYDTLINVNVLQLILATNLQEACELAATTIRNPMVWCALPALAAIFALAWVLVQGIRKSPSWLKTTIGIYLVLQTGLSACAQIPCYIKCARCFTAPNTDVIGDPYYRPYQYSPIVRTAFAFAFVNTESHEIEQLCQSIEHPTVLQCKPTCSTIVVIIGESYSKHHSGLYETEWEKVNPLLCALRDSNSLVVFSDVITPSNMTSHVMRHFLSTWTDDHNDNWEQHTLFPIVFREAGYRVGLLSNQYNKKSNDQWSIIGGTLFNNPILKEAQFDWSNDSICTYDEQVLAQLPAEAFNTDKPNLILIHLMGQHVAYNQRYPKQWNLFHEEDMHPSFGEEKAKRIAAEYANATRYNDYVVDSIWKMFKQTDAVCIYFSDHGEEVFDWRDFYERSDESKITPEIARYQFEVPMMIMMSDTFQTRHPETTEQIRQAAHKPTSNEHMAHLLFHLGGIETTEYDPTRDILSDRFDTLRPRYIGTGINYDELMRQN